MKIMHQLTKSLKSENHTVAFLYQQIKQLELEFVLYNLEFIHRTLKSAKVQKAGTHNHLHNQLYSIL